MAVSNIEIERVKLGLTKGQMAQALGVTGKTYHGYISGSNIPSSKLAQLADMTGMTTDYLLNRASA